MKLSIHDRMLPGGTYLEKYQNAQRLGFEAVELTPASPAALKQAVSEIKQAQQRTGIRAGSIVCGHRGWIGHYNPELRGQAVDDCIENLKAMAEMNCFKLVLPASFSVYSDVLSYAHEKRSRERDVPSLLESIHSIAQAAAPLGITIILEPINRYEDYLINRVAQAAELIQGLRQNNVKTMVDFFHANMEEQDIPTAIEENHLHIAHVHLADSGRYEPGTGHIDFFDGFDALTQIGYTGDYVLECALSGDPMQSLQKSVQFLKQVHQLCIME